MKTRLLIILGTIAIFVVFVIVYGVSVMESEFKPKTIFCDNDFIQQGNGCILDPKSIEPNTIVIYHVTEKNGIRLAIAPSKLVIDFEENNTVTWINQGIFTAKVTDRERGLWSIDEIKPSMQKSIQLNSTGFYSFLVVADMQGESGRIVVLGDDVDSLEIKEKLKMAQSILGAYFRKLPIIGIGAGNADNVLNVQIHEDELGKFPDAEEFYYNKVKEIIPFDVPIRIEFTPPITLN